MLKDITSSGVRSAIDEFDELGRIAFLDKYGFGKATKYFLVDGGKRYDSKAICGAAHGYDRPQEGPLRHEDFSGGEATVQTTLQQRGFVVEKVGPGWTPEERLLALDAYLDHGLASKTSEAVISLSAELIERAFHPDAGTRDNFRNPAGVALKLANFASLDPEHDGKGMDRVSAGDRQTWDEYAGDHDLIREVVARIRQGHSARPTSPDNTGPTRPVRKSIEQQHRATFSARPNTGGDRGRREAGLVLEFAAHLVQIGHDVCAHEYPVGEISLRNDIADETTRTLWEAKSSVDRSSVRNAIGQLLDYRRFEPADWQIGILLPRRPHDDLLELARSVPAHVAWLEREGGFRLSHSDSG